MGSLGLPEIIFIMVIALLIFGPKRLPEIGRTLGKGMAEFRKATNDLKQTITTELTIEDEQPARPRRVDLASVAPIIRIEQSTRGRGASRMGVIKDSRNRILLEWRATEGDSPVDETRVSLEEYPFEPRGRFSERSLTFMLVPKARARAVPSAPRGGEKARRRNDRGIGQAQGSIGPPQPANGGGSNGPDDGARPRGPRSRNRRERSWRTRGGKPPARCLGGRARRQGAR
jgi:TatA/E family protein of Tat protein translocase